MANAIVAQLGGHRFIAMTGAKHFVTDAKAVTFKLPAQLSKSGVNAVRIELNANDTYTVTFYKIGRGTTVTTLKALSGVMCDQLRAIFTQVTGLYTSL